MKKVAPGLGILEIKWSLREIEKRVVVVVVLIC